MGKVWDNVAPAIKKETKNVFITTTSGTVLMWIVFFAGHQILGEDVPFDYTVFTGGLGGLLMAVLNFFLMGLTVQKVSATEDEKIAHNLMKMSYTRRMLFQIVWIVIALVVPVFNWVAGILPLIFPSAGIKIKGLIDQKKYNKEKEVEQKQDGC